MNVIRVRAIEYLLVLAVPLFSACAPFHSPKIDPEGSASASKSASKPPEWFAEQESLRKQGLQRLASLRPVSDSLNYHLLPGDMLEISIHGVDQEQVHVRVDSDGTINVPLLKRLNTTGQTTREVEERLITAYRKFYIDPEVNVNVQEFRGRPISVFGNVDKPGTYFLTRDEMTLREVLALAGGFSREAGDRLLLIPGRLKNQSPAPQISMDAQESLSNDEAARVEEIPVIEKPVEMRAQLSEAGLTIPAGGASETGTFQILKEEVNGDSSSRAFNVAVRAGDSLILPSMGKVQVFGEVDKPGSIPLTEKMTVLGAIAAAGGVKFASNNTAEVIRLNADGTTVSTVVDLKKAVGDPDLDIRLEPGDSLRLPSSRLYYVIDSTVNAISKFFHTGLFYQVN